MLNNLKINYESLLLSKTFSIFANVEKQIYRLQVSQFNCDRLLSVGKPRYILYYLNILNYEETITFSSCSNLRS